MEKKVTIEINCVDIKTDKSFTVLIETTKENIEEALKNAPTLLMEISLKKDMILIAIEVSIFEKKDTIIDKIMLN